MITLVSSVYVFSLPLPRYKLVAPVFRGANTIIDDEVVLAPIRPWCLVDLPPVKIH
jgi:hypothetical protein